MVEEISPTRVLLVEDDKEYAKLITRLLEDLDDANFQTRHVSRLDDALQHLAEQTIDVALVDLMLPDSRGSETLVKIHETVPELPIVVMTGLSDADLALHCISNGAQDFICKDNIEPLMLRRVIGHALARMREHQLRDMQRTIDYYEALSSESGSTSETQSLIGLAAICQRHPQAFRKLTTDYQKLIELYIESNVLTQAKPTALMTAIITELGDLGASPRDLIDLHVKALTIQTERVLDVRARAYIIEGRLLALEMMGFLVDFYRLGTRRCMPESQESLL